MLSRMCMQSLATIGYEMKKKALADRKSDNNTNTENLNNNSNNNNINNNNNNALVVLISIRHVVLRYGFRVICQVLLVAVSGISTT